MVKKKAKAPIKSKELKLGELIGTGWEIYKKNFKLFLFIILIIYLPINIILNLVPGTSETFGGVMAYLRLTQILELVLGIIATMAIAYAVNKIVNHKKPELWESIKSALLVWDKAILTALLAGLILIVLYLLLIIPGIIYSVYYTFALYTVILKDKKYKKALDYSKSIVKGRWWRVFGIIIVVTLLFSFVAGIISSPIAIYENYITNVISDTVFDIIYALQTIVFAVLFINLSSIKKA